MTPVRHPLAAAFADAPPVASDVQQPATGVAALDDPQEWGAFGERQGDQWLSHLVIDGMHCAACAQTIESVLNQLPGVQARVSAAAQRVRVQWNPAQTLPSQWQQALTPLGYRLRPAIDATARAQRKLEARRLLWRWLVACVAMMQVMMYAWPEYIAQGDDLSAESLHLLRWASWVITLPVMLFSAGPFFQSAWRDLRQGHIGMDLPVALGMAITFAVSSWATFNPTGLLGGAVYFDSLTMFVFFLLAGRWLEARLRDQTAGALESLLNRVPQRLERRNPEGQFEWVALRQLRVGDVLRVHRGEAFAADGVLLQGRTWVDEAILSGESHPLTRETGQAVMAGSHNLGQTVLMCVTGLGEDTRYASIVRLIHQAATSKPRLAALADRVAKPFLAAVLLLAAGAAAWWWPHDHGQALMVAAAVLVVTCPCALSLATPVAMLASAGHLARRGMLVTRLQSLEALAEIDTVVFDKTGTLTQDRLRVQGIRTRAGVSDTQALQWAATVAQYALHPVSRALVQAAQDQGLMLQKCEHVEEVAGQGVVAQCNGNTWRLGRAAWCGIEPVAKGSEVHLSDAQGWVASFTWGEVLRDDALVTVQALQAAGVQVHILSGDQSDAVRRLGDALGLREVRGDCSPQDKLRALQALQAQGRRVAMVGDGLNDAPVLSAAHVSVALGQGMAVAHTRADLVLMGTALQSVAQAILLARRTRRVVRQNLGWALFYNLACVPLAVAGVLSAWVAGLGMVASSLVVVFNALRLSPTQKAER